MDHERVNISNSSISCGVMELSRIADDVADVAYSIGSRLYHPARGDPCAFLIWSDVNNDNSSKRLMDFIHDRKLGQCQISNFAENPKTGNIIVVYICTIDHPTWKKWYKDVRVFKLQKVGN